MEHLKNFFFAQSEPAAWVMVGNSRGTGKTELVKSFCYEQNIGEFSKAILWTDFAESRSIGGAEKLIDKTIDSVFPKPWVTTFDLRREYLCSCSILRS